MAGVQAAAGPGVMRGALRRGARFSSLNIRLTVLVSVVLIAGSFAAAAALQMRFARVHALSQAASFETERVRDMAALIDVALDQYADAARAFADDDPTALKSSPGLRNIALFDKSGVPTATMRGPPFPRLSLDSLAAANKAPVVVSSSIVAFAYKGRIVAALFDPQTLIPATMLNRSSIANADGSIIVAGAGFSSGSAVAARARDWPLRVETSIDEDAALAAWYGSLPLYLFVILGPAVVGAGLASLFVREFERRSKASEAIRQLRSARPMEARLLVRLAEAERRAFEAKRSKSEFIAHMSHELRTPLNAIIGFSEVIEHGYYGPPGHPKYVEYARDIGTAGRNLHAKIGDILEYANVEAGRFPLTPTCFDLSDLAHACANEHMGRAFSRRIALEVGVIEPVDALADIAAAKRIVTNLLANALHYTPEGGSVRIHVWEEEGAAVLTVHDSGTGFTKEEASRVGSAFLKFDRSGAATGAGMGLAIAMAMARRMGGAVRIGGHHGEGTSAELRLPKA